MTIEQQISKFMASYEVALAHITKREKILEEALHSTEQFINTQIEKIHQLLADLHEIINIDSPDNTKELQSLRKLNEDTKTLVSETCLRFERTSNTSIKQIHEAMDHFKIDDLKETLEKNYDHLKKTSSSVVEKIIHALNWFHWKSFILALGLSIVIGLGLGLYIDDEWPWESHAAVVKQRAAGEALLNALPNLSPADQRFIEEKILNNKK